MREITMGFDFLKQSILKGLQTSKSPARETKDGYPVFEYVTEKVDALTEEVKAMPDFKEMYLTMHVGEEVMRNRGKRFIEYFYNCEGLLFQTYAVNRIESTRPHDVFLGPLETLNWFEDRNTELYELDKQI